MRLLPPLAGIIQIFFIVYVYRLNASFEFLFIWIEIP